jgi:light-regulated signal transduction histidine kinase (bacteriophytochrome)
MSPQQTAEELTRQGEQQHFLDRAIHSLRAPLRGIGTSAALLLRKWNDRFDEESRELMHAILKGVTDLNDLTLELSDYSVALVPKSPLAKPLPVENALQTALARLQKEIVETGAKVHSGALPLLSADHEQLSILFHCLLSNALAYHGEAAPRIEITATRAGDEWRFSVSDNGIGIAPRFQQQVFEPFERLQSEPRGFGLGLAISRKIVAALGGKLWMDSKEGEGTTFFFALPAQTSSPG